jgi:hypothetical protein
VSFSDFLAETVRQFELRQAVQAALGQRDSRLAQLERVRTTAR